VDPVDPHVDGVGARPRPPVERDRLVLPLRGRPRDRGRRQACVRAAELLQGSPEAVAGQPTRVQQRQHLGHPEALARPRRHRASRRRHLPVLVVAVADHQPATVLVEQRRTRRTARLIGPRPLSDYLEHRRTLPSRRANADPDQNLPGLSLARDEPPLRPACRSVRRAISPDPRPQRVRLSRRTATRLHADLRKRRNVAERPFNTTSRRRPVLPGPHDYPQRVPHHDSSPDFARSEPELFHVTDGPQMRRMTPRPSPAGTPLEGRTWSGPWTASGCRTTCCLGTAHGCAGLRLPPRPKPIVSGTCRRPGG
jgi:hypothetical protein